MEDLAGEIYINLNPGIPALPRADDKTKIDVRYVLIAPYAFAHIYWDQGSSELLYEIEEPLLDASEKASLENLEKSMREVININILVERTPEAMMDYINKTAVLLISELNLKITKESYKKIFYYLFRDFIGLNEIEALTRDYFIEDIECNGIGTPVYIVHRIYRNLKTNTVYKDVDYLASFVEKLAQRCGRYISYASPILDGTLADGSRVNASYTTDITSKGPTFCFKSGYVQLNDGRVKKVNELFEESKTNFGARIEDGNEIVDVINTKCCGVHEEDLKQQESDIKTIIKLKSPEKLAKISFEDGGEIEVTLNHKFHIAEESLKLIEAKDLKEGMLVPIPRKIEVAGCRQKIDVYSLLKDYSYIKNICIVSNPQVKGIVSAAIGSNTREALAERYGTGQSYLYEIMSRGNSISFKVIDQLCSEQNFDLSNLDEISINVQGGGNKNKSKTLKVPKEISEDLAYLAGALVSDGHISQNNIDFSCYEEGFKNSVKEKLIKIFGKYESYYDDKRIYLCNSFIPYFFNKVFVIPIGKKCNIVKIPEIIMKSDNKVISAFIRGLYDGDGTCKSGLSYKTFSKDLAEGLTYLLARLGIYSYIRENKPEYRVNIPSPYYEDFSREIGFNNSFKKECLNDLIANQEEYKKNIRHDRIPGLPVLALLAKMGVNKTKLMEKCGFNYNRLGYLTFSRYFVKCLLEEIKDASPNELNYLKWLLECNQEFVKIEKIEIIDNSEPVYDLELEPCKFFVAGNKPMNVFDTIRKFTKVPWTPIQLIGLNTLSPEMLAYFWLLVQYKSNILITGGTSSGKTTLLNALAFFIPPEARVVSIEDTREISLPRENWLPSVARTAIGTGQTGEVDLFSLLKNSFRQNPDYVIVGEVRGKEAFVLFQGMASGHASISTMHADSVDTVIKRLETPPIELSPTLVNTLDIVAIMNHAIVNKQQTRRLREIVEIVKVDPQGIALTNTPFMWNPADDRFYFKKDSRVFDKIMQRYGLKKEELMMEFENRVKLLYEMYHRKIFSSEKVQEIVNEYYKNPAKILAEFNIK